MAPVVRTFLIADVRGYTRFTQDHGDEAAAELASSFADIVGRVVAEYDGRSDRAARRRGAWSSFASARQALRAQRWVQRRLSASNCRSGSASGWTPARRCRCLAADIAAAHSTLPRVSARLQRRASARERRRRASRPQGRRPPVPAPQSRAAQRNRGAREGQRGRPGRAVAAGAHAGCGAAATSEPKLAHRQYGRSRPAGRRPACDLPHRQRFRR